MLRLLFSALALLACACAHSATIDQVQQRTGVAPLANLANMRAANLPAADRRTPAPDRLKAAASSASAGLNSTLYRYDADGNLVGEVVGAGTPQEQRVTYTVDTQTYPAVVIAEAVNGRITRSYHWEFGNELQSFSDHLPDGSSVTYFAHLDGQGSIRFLTDRQGNVTDTFDYDAGGNVIARTGDTDLRFLFRGEHLNNRTGWYHLRARWLNPSAGRFATQDPFIGISQDPASLHRYMYAHNNSVNLRDPSGRMTVKEFAVAAAVNATLGAFASGGITYYKTRNIQQSIESAGVGAIVGVVIGGIFQGVKAVVAYRMTSANVAVRGAAAISDDAIISADKLRYLLVLDPGKANGFKLLGYTSENAAALEKMLAASRSLIDETAQVIETQYGTNYRVVMQIVGPNGKAGTVEVGWFVRKGEEVYRLVTAIPHPFK